MNRFFLGLDIGSSYTKYIIIDNFKNIVYENFSKSLTRNKNIEQNIRNHIQENFEICQTGVTGYGRNHYSQSSVVKTELYCASKAMSELYNYEKMIVDIGGEDIKIIKSAAGGKVIDFYMNSKCAAGTGAFISETAERAEINISEMSELASKSKINRELNSFCTVFAKTEIMQWIFDKVEPEDIAKGIYISTIKRIIKNKIDYNLPIFLIGGVAEYHPYIRNVMSELIGKEVVIPDKPQFINAYGAALFAIESFNL
ncbi:MAG: acyl-CoA dehydratase activase [Candidatus Kapabacteria bacterium]|nr:acyl-CoA dehydratase activase [Candidatus Kapabacteria bacterium]